MWGQNIAGSYARAEVPARFGTVDENTGPRTGLIFCARRIAAATHALADALALKAKTSEALSAFARTFTDRADEAIDSRYTLGQVFGECAVFARTGILARIAFGDRTPRLRVGRSACITRKRGISCFGAVALPDESAVVNDGLRIEAAPTGIIFVRAA